MEGLGDTHFPRASKLGSASLSPAPAPQKREAELVWEHWRSRGPLSWVSPGQGLSSMSFGVSPPQRKGFHCLIRAPGPLS